jgi:hypothetical protein
MNNKTDNHELSFLASNDYWGRGIMIGNTEDQRITVAYFIMGRSVNSRNRYFYQEGDRVAIAPYDKDKLEDPSLIIYYPIKTVSDQLIVTNGDQTDTVEEYLNSGRSFEDALRTRKFEPDEPHFTPRISGVIDTKTGDFKLSILKNIDGKGEACGRYFYEYAPLPGTGRFIHTYEGNGNPLPTFEGEPWKVAIPNTLDEMTSQIWNSLNDDNKISLCTMIIDPASGEREMKILNKRMGD